MPECRRTRASMGLLYGKPYRTADTPATNLELWLRKVEVAGPHSTRSAAGGEAAGPALADNFMVLTRDHLGWRELVKVWRKDGVAVVLEPPAKFQNWEQATADLGAPNTWRHQAAWAPVPVETDETTIRRCARCWPRTRGEAAAGVRGAAVGRGQRADSVGRRDAAGRQAEPVPGMEHAAQRLRERRAAAGPGLALEHSAVHRRLMVAVLREPGGLRGRRAGFCPARSAGPWTWNFATQFAGPVVPMAKGVDTRETASGNGYVPWANSTRRGA